jgi:hypothetical protein
LRAGQVEVLFQPTGGAGLFGRQRYERRDKRAGEQQGAAGHAQAPSTQGAATVTADPGGIKMPSLRTGKKAPSVAFRQRSGFPRRPGFASDRRAV